MIEAAVKGLLTSDATVSGIVSARVYPIALPQDAMLPAISYSRVSTFDKSLTHSGTNKAARTVLQISCWARSALAAKNLANAVKAVLHGYSGETSGETIFSSQVVNEVDLFDPEVGIYQIPVDVTVHHRDL